MNCKVIAGKIDGKWIDTSDWSSGQIVQLEPAPFFHRVPISPEWNAEQQMQIITEYRRSLLEHRGLSNNADVAVYASEPRVQVGPILKPGETGELQT